MAIQLEQRVDLRKISENKWRLIGLLGRATFFYAESTSGDPPFTVTNEYAAADVGQWRGIDRGRALIIGQGGKATVTPKPDGNKGDVQVTFEGIGLAL